MSHEARQAPAWLIFDVRQNMKRNHFVLCAAAIVCLWVATPLLLKWHYRDDPAARGQFGDMFGAVNALFTGAALLGAIYAIRLQTEELGLQREELRKSTEEFKAQNEILRAQLEAAKAAQAAAEAKERLASMPFLRYRGGSQDAAGDKLEFENVGGDIYDLAVTTEGGHLFRSLTRKDMWRSGETAFVYIGAPVSGKRPGATWAFTFQFTTKLGAGGAVRFEVDAKGTPKKQDAS